MYVTDDMIAEMVQRHGEPYERTFRIPATDVELARIRSSQKAGRNHDVTVYVRRGDKLIVMAKHMYPPGLFRSPSGGLKPGESIEDGIHREIAEELGCEIKLDRFLLTTLVNFENGHDCLFWRSFVFTADYVSGDLNFTDTKEVRELAVVPWSAFDEYGETMRQTDLAGLHYRAELHETVVELLAEDNGTPSGGGPQA